jgi:hypothetical protein
MQSNPLAEWQRLTQLYREKNDDELLDLAADSADLTEVAQQILRDEMKQRSLDEPRHGTSELHEPKRSPASSWAPSINAPAGGQPDAHDRRDQSNSSYELSWKALLCECDDREQANQISEALRQRGIESWIEIPGSNSLYSQLDLRSPRILVAADQLDEAREIVARPIPQEIIDQSKLLTPEFVPPPCPNCGAVDPTLEGVDPSNRWHCEACGKRWADMSAELPGNSD